MLWIHRFYENELGYRKGAKGAGSHITLPQNIAEEIYREDGDTVPVLYNGIQCKVTIKERPAPRVETWLTGLEAIDPTRELLIPNVIAMFFLDKTNTTLLLVKPGSSQYDDLNSFLQQNLQGQRKYDCTVSDVTAVSIKTNETFTIIPKPFLLLAGISGTGKTRFVREQAKASAKYFNIPENQNFCLVPVRPDWHEPSDLLGYVSRINGEQYVVTKFLEFIVKAWYFSGYNPKNDGVWVKAKNRQSIPFWLCLDEMNLAPVEQYFADYLSVLETRTWSHDEYKCHPLVLNSILTGNDSSSNKKYSKDLRAELEKFIRLEGVTTDISLNSSDSVKGKSRLDEFNKWLLKQMKATTTSSIYLRALKRIVIHHYGLNCKIDELSDEKFFEFLSIDYKKSIEIIGSYSAAYETYTDDSSYWDWAKQDRDKKYDEDGNVRNGAESAVAGKYLSFLKSAIKNDVDDTSEDFFEILWQSFITNGIQIPPNLIVAGTVNMDETTHGFSRKVIDRALTIDFQEFFPNNYDHFFEDQVAPKTFSFPTQSQVVNRKLMPVVDQKQDTDSSKSVEFLKAINTILQNTPFELAYRALNELLLSVVSFSPETDEGLQAVWDDYLMQKVLPRIEGDSQKMKYVPENESGIIESKELEGSEKVYGKGSLLHQLFVLLETDLLKEIWEDKKRPDLLRETDEKIECRSKKKLLWMMKRLKANHFTDFWV